jgi:EF hand
MNNSNKMSLAVAALLAAAATHAQAPGGPPGGGPGGGQQITPDFVMANNDLNKDGVITKEEATKAGKQLIQVWDTYDLNKDGKVDRDELVKGLAGGMGGGPGAGGPPAGGPPAPAAAQKPATPPAGSK